MSEKNALSQKQYDNVLNRIYELENVLIPENAKALKAAKEQGDLSENAEYDDAKEEQAKLHQELAVLKNKKDKAIIIKRPSHNAHVEVGHQVTIEYLGKNLQKTLILLGEWDKTEFTTSVEAPLGQALLGKKPEEVFIVEPENAPNELEVRLLAIDFPKD